MESVLFIEMLKQTIFWSADPNTRIMWPWNSPTSGWHEDYPNTLMWLVVTQLVHRYFWRQKRYWKNRLARQSTCGPAVWFYLFFLRATLHFGAAMMRSCCCLFSKAITQCLRPIGTTSQTKRKILFSGYSLWNLVIDWQLQKRSITHGCKWPPCIHRRNILRGETLQQLFAEYAQCWSFEKWTSKHLAWKDNCQNRTFWA